MKTCCRCNVDKPLTEFRKDKSRSNGVHPWCTACAKSYTRAAYTEKYGTLYNKRQQALRQEGARRFKIVKEQNPCVVCGEGDPSCIDFHHMDPTEKESDMSQRKTSWNFIVTEMKKCISLCANCHRKFHAGTLLLDYDKVPRITYTDFGPMPKFKVEDFR